MEKTKNLELLNNARKVSLALLDNLMQLQAIGDEIQYNNNTLVDIIEKLGKESANIINKCSDAYNESLWM